MSQTLTHTEENPETKPGYKKTELGWIPEEWEIVYFNKLADFKNGLNFSKNEITGKGIKIIGVNDFKDHYSILYNNLKKVNVASIDSSYLLEDEDILFVRSNGNKELIGRALYIKNINEPITHSGFTIRARLISKYEEVLPSYIAYLFRSRIIKQQFLKLGGGTNISNLTQNILSNLLIPLPPLPQQQKIAEILSTWDQAIEKTEALIQAKECLKKGLMQQLLTGKARFKEFEGEWKIKKLEDCAEIRLSNVDKHIKPNEHSVFLCNYLDVYNNQSITSDTPFTSGTVNEQEFEKFSLIKGDVIITKDSEARDDIAIPTYVAEDIPNLVCAYHLALLRPTPVIKGSFLAKVLQSHEINHAFQRRANGITRFGLNAQTIKTALIPVPSIKEQQKIASTLSTCDQEIEQLKQKLENLKTQKQGLMQQLLNGNIKVV